MPEVKRQLAAIMFTDIVGYTSLMGEEEERALELLRKNRDLQKPLIEQHNGKWIKEIGDGVIAMFDSALDSVQCAVDIQKASRAGFEGKIRIAIHLGDITIEDNDVYGDGVNIASRLQSIALPGGICISESVQRAIRGRSEIQLKYLGSFELKNVNYPVNTYSILGEGLPIPDVKESPSDKVQPKTSIVAQINDQFISEVFNELVKVKPALSRFLVVDEDEDEEDLDIRLLADQMVKNYPWPIGVELRRLFSGTMRSFDRRRLDQLNKTIERTLQFLSFIMVIELYEAAANGKIKLEASFIKEFQQRFITLSLNDCAWIIKTIGNLFAKSKLEYFVSEMKNLQREDFYAALDFSASDNTQIEVNHSNLEDEEVERLCIEYLDKLVIILTGMAFIVNYKLVTMKEIKVLKYKHKEVLFEHWMDLLNSSDSDFRSKGEIFNTFSDSNSILLMKSLKEPGKFLNLSPLIIDTRSEVIDSKDKNNLQKDIFVYSKFIDNKIFYWGTEYKVLSDLSILNNYQILVDEFNEILNISVLPSPAK